ncbi:MAG TPA: DUF1844 domain-containing protein [Pyrinomonadaceae bacterium]|nr:DUF1844 domain-containing protein [Pyrinomonadaceae bacterium]
MSEEKPTFKVTDRRLFNPDGTPRDIERGKEEPAAATTESAPAATATPTEAATPQTVAPPADAARREPSEPPPVETTREPRIASTDAAADAAASGAPEDAAAGDPTAFANLVMFIASPAAAAMGMTEHPGLAPGELDLPLAKHCIDLLGTIQQKTRGNLGKQEQQILEGLLSELRMQYISLTPTQRPTAPPPRGFSGSDITGGR